MFIKLTYIDDTDTWVNVDQILAFETSTEVTYTRVIIGGLTSEVTVKETPEQILAKIHGQKLHEFN